MIYTLYKINGTGASRKWTMLAHYNEAANEHPNYSMRDHAIRDARTLTKAGMNVVLYGGNEKVEF
jgi:hypothetical protein